MKNLKFINKIVKADESGRSMVEMLGVLAIVGVISIGGIAGYIYGMNRYRTNEILDGGTKRAVLVASQLASEITPNLTEFVDYDETAGGTFSSDVEVWENEFGIQVSGVKKEVCENLIRMIGDNTPLRGIVNVDGEGEADLNPGECADGTNNNLYLVYNLEMLSKGAVDSGSRDGTPSNAGGCAGGAERVNKIYYTGVCCNEQTSDLFCPEESVPTCFATAELDVCEPSCGEISNAGPECCALESDRNFWSNSSQTCCDLDSSDGACCESAGYHWDGDVCCVKGTENENCCTHLNYQWSDETGECCVSGTEYNNHDCCMKIIGIEEDCEV